MNKYTQRLEKIEAVLDKNLPEMFSPEFIKSVFLDLPEAVCDTHFKPLVSPCRELLLLGGKRWRPLLMVLCAELFNDDGSVLSVYEAVPLVEFIHTASLIHDDIEDCADMRRGNPSAYITHGLDTALNAGSWLYFSTYAVIERLPVCDDVKLVLYRIVSAELRRLHLGQAMDIAWHRNPATIPGRDEYEAMVRMKTGTLACLSAKIGCIMAGATESQADHLGKLAADIGVGFQVLDDVINVTSGNPGKKRGDDIVEGKKSLPVLMHLQIHPEDAAFIASCFEAARSGGINVPEVEQCITMITKSGAVAQAAEYSRCLIDSACETISTQFKSKEAATLISELFLSMLKKNLK